MLHRSTILAQTVFFQDFPDASRQALADICRTKNLPKRTIIFREGDPGEAIYLLHRGSVRLYKTIPTGREVVITIARPGELFAEAVLTERDRYPVSAETLVASSLFVFLRQDLHRLLESAEFRDDFIGLLLRRYRLLTERIVQLMAEDVERRFFIFLSDQYGDTTDLRLTIAKKDIAAAIGTQPETLSRHLVRLQRQGLLRVEGRRLILVRPAAELARHSSRARS